MFHLWCNVPVQEPTMAAEKVQLGLVNFLYEIIAHFQKSGVCAILPQTIYRQVYLKPCYLISVPQRAQLWTSAVCACQFDLPPGNFFCLRSLFIQLALLVPTVSCILSRAARTSSLVAQYSRI